MAENSNGRWRSWLAGLAVVALAVGGCGRKQPLSYNTTTVERSELTKLVTATGTLNPVVNVTVGSQVSGRISKLNVDFNSVVTSNEVIAEIDPATYQAAVEQAAADLANARANLELQQVEADRSSDLFTNKLISGSDHDTALATLHEADAMVKIKQASLNNALVNLDYCKIVSPVDGVVILRAVELGQTVASSFSTPTIFQIANDLTRMQIDSSVAEADVGGIVEGQEVTFTVDAYPERTFQGSVTQVRNSPTTVNNVVTYDCVIGVTNADLKLKPGMTANVSISVAHRDNALTIPNGALRFRPPDSLPMDTNAMAGAPTNATNAGGNYAGGGAGPAGGQNGGGGPGGPGGPGARHGGGHNRGEHPTLHTIYVLVGDGPDQKLQAVQVRTGISDGISTEVVSGVDEGAKVVTSVMLTGAQAVVGANPLAAAAVSGAAGVERLLIFVQTNPVIKLDAIHKVYHTGEVDVHAVRGISLDIFPGEFVAIMGSSGSGKSTLMNMIGALDRPTGGHYWLDGADVSTLNRDELADVRNAKIGFVFQGFNLLSRTSALENVEMPMQYNRHRIHAREQRERAMHSLALVGLGDRADHHPNQLSGGQQQRVAIARGLVNRPTLLLADEPTGNLDTQTSIEIMGVFQKLNDQGITIIMVTHELDVARYTKRMVILRDGKIVTDELVQNRSVAETEIQKLRAAQQAVKLG